MRRFNLKGKINTKEYSRSSQGKLKVIKKVGSPASIV